MKKKTSKVHWPLTRLERLSVYKARCVAWPQFSQKERKNLPLLWQNSSRLHMYSNIMQVLSYINSKFSRLSAQGCQKVCKSVGHVVMRWAQSGSLVDIGSTDLPKTGGVGGGMCSPPAPGGLWPCCMVAMSHLDTRAGWVRLAEKS